MKKPLFFLVIVFLLQSCSEKNDVSFSIQEVVTEDCAACPLVRLQYHKAEGNIPAAAAINRAIEEEMIAHLHFRDDMDVQTLKDAIRSFSRSSGDLPFEMSAPWEAEIKTRVTHQDDKFITLAMDIYIFTGGAHGLAQTRYLNFDARRGDELESWELFHDNSQFRSFAEMEFRKQNKIPEAQPINSTGYMFPENRFSLPDNIGLSGQNLILHYNPYEVSGAPEEPIILEIPYTKAERFLSRG